MACTQSQSRGALVRQTLALSSLLPHFLRSQALRWGGAAGIRTPDLLIANETRYQLRHSPMVRPNFNTSATSS